MTQENQQPVKDNGEKESQCPKRRPLIADLWEDVVARHEITKDGGNDDESFRGYVQIDDKTGKIKVKSIGWAESLRKLESALNPDVVHEKVEIKSYPGDPDFPIDKAKEIAAPFFIRTLIAERERIGVSEPPIIEKGLITFGEIIESDLKRLFGGKDHLE